jgi:hypothetical protein
LRLAFFVEGMTYANSPRLARGHEKIKINKKLFA